MSHIAMEDAKIRALQITEAVSSDALDEFKCNVEKGGAKVKDIKIKEGNHNSNQVKIRRGNVETTTTIWECDCYGKWKEPPEIIVRHYVDKAWSR